jgi:hypothetical protein
MSSRFVLQFGAEHSAAIQSYRLNRRGQSEGRWHGCRNLLVIGILHIDRAGCSLAKTLLLAATPSYTGSKSQEHLRS